MDFSNNNIVLWNPIIQLGIIAVFVLIANILRRKIKFILTRSIIIFCKNIII